MKQILITILTLILFISTTCGQTKNENETIQQINTYLSELERIGFNGSVVIELNGKKVISEGYGFSDKEQQLKNSSNTIFSVGSLTKQFTAAAILKLEMQGKLKTSDTITKYFKTVSIDKSTITIHDLLRHQSGLQSNLVSDYEQISETDFLDLLMNSPLSFKTGTNFSYSNIGYSLLALIIEKVTGESYEKYLYEYLWKPSKMEMTGYSRPEFDENLIAVGYYRNDSVWGKPTSKNWNGNEPYLNLKGNGGILSTTEDLYKWNKALMTENILSKDAKQKLYHPKLRPNEEDNSYYAYGWDVHKTDRNTFRVWHNGSNNIFYADFMRFIDENTSLIMMSNKSNPNTDYLNFELAKIIFKKNYKPTIPAADNETNQKFSQEIIETVLKTGLGDAKLKFKKRPSKTAILENVLNAKGYDLLSQNQYDEAISIFTMNTIAYPKSFNAFDSLGEGYMNKGDKVSAIKNYEKSLQLDPTNNNAVEMIKKMKK